MQSNLLNIWIQDSKSTIKFKILEYWFFKDSLNQMQKRKLLPFIFTSFHISLFADIQSSLFVLLPLWSIILTSLLLLLPLGYYFLSAISLSYTFDPMDFLFLPLHVWSYRFDQFLLFLPLWQQCQRHIISASYCAHIEFAIAPVSPSVSLLVFVLEFQHFNYFKKNLK